MAKKDIGKILTTGSYKQRLLLLAEDNARARFNQERLLTDSEINQLSDSFKKPNEIKLWNHWLEVDRKVTTGIMNLQTMKFEVLMHFSNLRGYILVWDNIQEAEALSNHILHEIKDQKERIKISTLASKLSKFLFTETIPDKEGYLDISIDFEEDDSRIENGKIVGRGKRTKRFSLWHVMNNVRAEAISGAVRFLTFRQVILDYMEEEGFNIDAHKKIIEKMTEDVYKPIIGWTKYQSDEKSFIPGIEMRRADKLKSKYSITPDISKLEIDREAYDIYKNEMIAKG